MAAGRAPPPSPGGAASSVTRGRIAGGAQPWRPAELPPSPAFTRQVSRTRGCLLLVGSSVARPIASSSSAGLDAWIHAQSRSMTLSEHRKLEEVRIMHVWPKAMCVCIRRGAGLAHRASTAGQVDKGPRLTMTCSSCLCSCSTSDQFLHPYPIYFPLSWSLLFWSLL
jgi:hypothetical protein